MGSQALGCYLKQTEEGWLMVASTQSSVAFGYLGFMLVWTVGIALGCLNMMLTEWTWQVVVDMWPQLLMCWVFVMVGVLYWWYTAIFFAGRYEILVGDREATIRLCVGNVGWKRRIDWQNIHNVDECVNIFNRNYWGFNHHAIALNGVKKVKFGMFLKNEQRLWMIAQLRSKISTYAHDPLIFTNKKRPL